MDHMQTMVRTQIAMDGSNFLLAQGQDLDDLKRRIEDAARSGARFVDFVVVGNRNVSVFVSSGTEVVISIETVQYDPRDTGDEETPFGGEFDF